MRAPQSSSSRTVASWPFQAAQSSDVHPSEDVASMRAPRSSSSSTVASWPLEAAWSSAVHPLSPLPLIL